MPALSSFFGQRPAHEIGGVPTLLRHENFVLTGNWGNFSSQNAVGFNGALKLDQNISLNAGVGVGLDTNRVASRAGFRIGF